MKVQINIQIDCELYDVTIEDGALKIGAIQPRTKPNKSSNGLIEQLRRAAEKNPRAIRF